MKKILVIVLIIINAIHDIKANEYFENHTDWSTYCMRASNIQITKNEYQKLIVAEDRFQKFTNLSNILIKNGHANEKYENWSPYYGDVYVDLSLLPKADVIDSQITKTIVFYMDEHERATNYIAALVTIVPDESDTQKPNVPIDPIFPDNPEHPSKPIVGEGGIKNDAVEEDSPSIGKAKAPYEGIDRNEKSKQKKEESTFIDWLLSGENVTVKIPILGLTLHMTPLSFTQSSVSGVILFLVFILFLNDIRILRKYKKDKESYLCMRYK